MRDREEPAAAAGPCRAFRRRGPPSVSGGRVAAILLDPILRLWERADRRRRHIRPIRRDGVFGVELRSYRGPEVRLADGTVVRRGDRVGSFHVRNERAREFDGRRWLVAGWRAGRADMAALASWSARQRAAVRPVAYEGRTVLAPFARRAGFEVLPLVRTWRIRLDEWFMRWLMARFAAAGSERLRHGRGEMRARAVWLSDDALQRLYGTPESSDRASRAEG